MVRNSRTTWLPRGINANIALILILDNSGADWRCLSRVYFTAERAKFKRYSLFLIQACDIEKISFHTRFLGCALSQFDFDFRLESLSR